MLFPGRVNETRPGAPSDQRAKTDPVPHEPGRFSFEDSMGRPNEIARCDQREHRSGSPWKEHPYLTPLLPEMGAWERTNVPDDFAVMSMCSGITF